MELWRVITKSSARKLNKINNMKQIFKVGDRVFDIRHGWGKVVKIYENNRYAVGVCFDNGDDARYTHDGKFYTTDLHPSLSFTEYFLQGFSQERIINYNDYIGCWGRFWDEEGDSKVEGILEIIQTGRYPYCNKRGVGCKHFEPYPQEVLTALGLTNENNVI